MKLNDAPYIFDTCIFIDYLRGIPVAQTIMGQVRSQKIQVSYSIISEAELWVGIFTKGRTIQEHAALLRPFKRIFLNVAIAHRAGEIQARLFGKGEKNIPDIGDCIIAATAERYHLRICTRNSQHFQLFRTFNIAVDEYSR